MVPSYNELYTLYRTELIPATVTFGIPLGLSWFVYVPSGAYGRLASVQGNKSHEHMQVWDGFEATIWRFASQYSTHFVIGIPRILHGIDNIWSMTINVYFNLFRYLRLLVHNIYVSFFKLIHISVYVFFLLFLIWTLHGEQGLRYVGDEVHITALQEWWV